MISLDPLRCPSGMRPIVGKMRSPSSYMRAMHTMKRIWLARSFEDHLDLPMLYLRIVQLKFMPSQFTMSRWL